MTALPIPHHWSLFLDVDGTLLDFAATPDGVSVDQSLHEILLRTRDAAQGAMALISGRSLAQLDRMFSPTLWPAAGLHGLERRDAAGQTHLARTDESVLDDARVALAEIAAAAPGVILEDKGLAIALHYRSAPAFERHLRREVGAIARRLGAGYHVQEGSRVLELKPAAATKADAIRAFMAEEPFAGRRPVFVGDDLTDLDGFAAVERLGGLSVAVGDRVNAMSRVSSPRDVRALLEDLADDKVAC